ncbi:MAG: D-alanyl-D-alanine carboxypeptidase [Acetobacteraceae bacterium]|nr:D-alanyl-D-alanine carboxypeptidase [Acetobacteraceae bacterium]
MLGEPGRRRVFTACLCVALTSICMLRPLPARAQIGSERYSSTVINAKSGAVLEAVNADEPRRPASLAKLMTLYMVFEALRDRRVTPDELVPISDHAAMQPASKLGLMPGSAITVEEAILGLITRSANDAAAALGELLGGNEDRFAQMMTLRARGLGMSHTTFRNASGLPDPDQWTTARDLATLSRRILTDFPTDYGYFNTRSFFFHGRLILNHDSMLQTYPGADGIKTGYTEASGHNLITSAERDGVRLVGVLLGAGSNVERDTHMAELLDQGFEQYDIQPEPRAPVVAGEHAPGMIAAAQTQPVARPVATHQGMRMAALRHAAARGAQSAGWGIQVGTFGSERAARAAAAAAVRVADSGGTRVEPTRLHGRLAWRAQLVGLRIGEAHSACGTLSRHRAACLVVRPEAGQIAIR